MERFEKIEWRVCDALQPYHEIYEERKKLTIQTKLSMFVKKILLRLHPVVFLPPEPPHQPQMTVPYPSHLTTPPRTVTQMVVNLLPQIHNRVKLIFFSPGNFVFPVTFSVSLGFAIMNSVLRSHWFI